MVRLMSMWLVLMALCAPGCKKSETSGPAVGKASEPEKAKPARERLQGSWRVDVEKFKELNAEKAGMADMISNMSVSIAADTFKMDVGDMAMDFKLAVTAEDGDAVDFELTDKKGKAQKMRAELSGKDAVVIFEAEKPDMKIPYLRKGAEVAKEDGDDGPSDARSIEAKVSLMKIAKSAQVYYATPHVDRTGSKVACQFPATVGWSHETLPCGLDGKRYAADSKPWSVETWTALNFEMNDAHYFRYKIDSSGSLGDAKMTATAEGDPDCDGKPVTMTVEVVGSPNATRAECTGKAGKIEVKE